MRDRTSEHEDERPPAVRTLRIDAAGGRIEPAMTPGPTRWQAEMAAHVAWVLHVDAVPAPGVIDLRRPRSVSDLGAGATAPTACCICGARLAPRCACIPC